VQKAGRNNKKFAPLMKNTEGYLKSITKKSR